MTIDLNALGIDMATLKKMAKQLKDEPLLKQAFEEQLRNEDFEGTVDEFYEELKDILNHGQSPKK